jgi:Uma2 family endonuclease
MTQPTTPTAPSPRKPPGRGEPSWNIAFLFPAQGEWSEDEYLSLDTNRLVELADGFVEVLPMPNPYHQLVVAFLYERLKAFITARTLGQVYFAPLRVRLWERTMRQPDVVFSRPGRVRNPRAPVEGADLVMEVVSEGEETRDRDLNVKRAEYARGGVPEYWIVDPETQRITVLVLEGGAYREHGAYGPGQKAASVLLAGFEVAVDEVLAAGEVAR